MLARCNISRTLGIWRRQRPHKSIVKKGRPSPGGRRACIATNPAALLQSLHPPPASMNMPQQKNHTQLRETGSNADASQDRTLRQNSGLPKHAEAGRRRRCPQNSPRMHAALSLSHGGPAWGRSSPAEDKDTGFSAPGAHSAWPSLSHRNASGWARQQPPQTQGSPPPAFGDAASTAPRHRNEEQAIRQAGRGRVQPPKRRWKDQPKRSACHQEASLRAATISRPDQRGSVTHSYQRCAAC